MEEVIGAWGRGRRVYVCQVNERTPTTGSCWSGDTERCEIGPGVPGFLNGLSQTFKVFKLKWQFDFHQSSLSGGCDMEKISKSNLSASISELRKKAAAPLSWVT